MLFLPRFLSCFSLFHSLQWGSVCLPTKLPLGAGRRVWKGSARCEQGLETRPMLSHRVCSTLPTQPGSPCPAIMQMRLFLLGTWHSREHSWEHSLLAARAASPPDLRALTGAAILTRQGFTASLLSLSLISTWKEAKWKAPS